MVGLTMVGTIGVFLIVLIGWVIKEKDYSLAIILLVGMLLPIIIMMVLLITINWF